jgi:hypothetical protein
MTVKTYEETEREVLHDLENDNGVEEMFDQIIEECKRDPESLRNLLIDSLVKERMLSDLKEVLDALF